MQSQSQCCFYSRTAICLGFNRQSTQRSKATQQGNTYLLNRQSFQCVGSQQFTVCYHFTAGSYRTVLYVLMRCVLVMLKCWECSINLLDVIYEIAQELSINIVYTYMMVAAVHIIAKTWRLVGCQVNNSDIYRYISYIYVYMTDAAVHVIAKTWSLVGC